jgi:hypothetical protein
MVGAIGRFGAAAAEEESDHREGMMSQAMTPHGSHTAEAWELDVTETRRMGVEAEAFSYGLRAVPASLRPRPQARCRLRGSRRTPYDGDLHLLDGPGWWQPWAAGTAVLGVPALLWMVPGHPWWEFLPAFIMIAAGLVFTQRGWRRGNPVQRAMSVGLALVLLALAAKLGDWMLGMQVHGSIAPTVRAYHQ